MNKQSTITQAFANVISRLRKAKGISQEQFAWDCSSTQKYISDIELGKRNVSILFAKKCAEALDLSLRSLFVLIDLEMEELKHNQP